MKYDVHGVFMIWKQSMLYVETMANKHLPELLLIDLYI